MAGCAHLAEADQVGKWRGKDTGSITNDQCCVDCDAEDYVLVCLTCGELRCTR